MTTNLSLGLGLGKTSSDEDLAMVEWLQARQWGLAMSKSKCSDAAKARHRPRGRMGLSYNNQFLNRDRTLDCILRKLYRNLSFCSIKDTSHQRGFGSIFNLEFSPDGRVLVAACERRAMIMFDPLTSKPINNVKNAHRDCVNCITFFDDRTFVSGSDDNTIALWDIRNTKSKVRSFQGHTNWVKSIEFCRQTKQMISSGFDGNVFLWDINRYVSEMNKPQYNSLLNFTALMRMRITPDSTKMLLSSASGLYVIIHDLDLAHIANDMEGIRDFTRLCKMQEDRSHIFYRKRNRIEIVNDFPNGSAGDELCISSLVVHPQGWCMISRLSTDNDNLEYTCVHDIQENTSTIAFCEEGRNFFRYHGYYAPIKLHKRLLYHIDEPSDGKGYIKELSVSPDGRLICSSFGYGIRLLAFDTGICEMCDLQQTQTSNPTQLYEMKALYNHRQTVLTSAFSPHQCLLVSGCLNGRVVFYSPRL